MWYVIQTQTGHEEELLLLMKEVIHKNSYNKCFFLKTEWPKRLQGRWQYQIRTMFPGYVFVDTEEPNAFFEDLRRISWYAKLLESDRYEFIPLKAEEENFLRILTADTDGEHRIIHSSIVAVTKDGNIQICSGALKYFENDILKINLHKRYALVNINMLGEKTVLFGIKLKKTSGKTTDIVSSR